MEVVCDNKELRAATAPYEVILTEEIHTVTILKNVYETWFTNENDFCTELGFAISKSGSAMSSQVSEDSIHSSIDTQTEELTISAATITRSESHKVFLHA